jgi:predicted CoA-substrate-specific enzyme activase
MSEREEKPCWLGLDIGSISVNAALIDGNGTLLFKGYRRVDGHPLAASQAMLAQVRDAMPAGGAVAGCGVTGSGRSLVGAAFGADVVRNEISAHARAAIHLHPDVRTVFEIGGQDSKATMIRDGVVVDFAMNLVCAAGTGSFLDSQARRLNMTVAELSEQAMRAERPTPIAGRCTVFAESDMIHKQQIGHSQDAIVLGLCYAMARNFLSNVCAGKEIVPPILLQGGVSANRGIRRAFEDLLGREVVVPEHHMVMGAFGAALLALRAAVRQTRFRGFDVCMRPIHTRAFVCQDCSNQCEIMEILDGDTPMGRSGGRCRKWETG